MIELLLRLFGALMLAGGGLSAAVAIAEYSRADATLNAAAVQIALQFRIDMTDAVLLCGGGLLCIGTAAALSLMTSHWERARDPYDDHPKMAREVAQAMTLPDPHAE